MVSERQRIEGAPPVVESSMPPPPVYEEVNGIFMRNTVAELVETVEYFLAEVTCFVTLHKFVAARR
jgi:hypothetical protein